MLINIHIGLFIQLPRKIEPIKDFHHGYLSLPAANYAK